MRTDSYVISQITSEIHRETLNHIFSGSPGGGWSLLLRV